MVDLFAELYDTSTLLLYVVAAEWKSTSLIWGIIMSMFFVSCDSSLQSLIRRDRPRFEHCCCGLLWLVFFMRYSEDKKAPSPALLQRKL